MSLAVNRGLSPILNSVLWARKGLGHRVHHQSACILIPLLRMRLDVLGYDCGILAPSYSSWYAEQDAVSYIYHATDIASEQSRLKVVSPLRFILHHPALQLIPVGERRTGSTGENECHKKQSNLFCGCHIGLD